MDQDNIRNLLEKYLLGTCSQQEKEIIDRWFEADQGEEQTLPANKARQLEEEILSRVQSHLPQEVAIRNKQRAGWFVSRIAASILLLIGIFIFFSKQPKKTDGAKQAVPKLFSFHTEPGQRAKLRLPDSSIIWLNGNTAIRYDQHFAGPDRAVYLDKGEAFFDVHPDTHKPFIVHTAVLKTQILGTSFNLQVQNHRNEYTLSVHTGKVRVSHEQSKAKHILLEAGQQFIYSYGDAHQQVKTIQSGNEHAWIYNELVFRNATWGDVVAQLETWYGVTIHLDLQKGRQDTFTAKFEDASLGSVLKALQKINSFQYTIKKKEVYIFKNTH